MECVNIHQCDTDIVKISPLSLNLTLITTICCRVNFIGFCPSCGFLRCLLLYAWMIFARFTQFSQWTLSSTLLSSSYILVARNLCIFSQLHECLMFYPADFDCYLGLILYSIFEFIGFTWSSLLGHWAYSLVVSSSYFSLLRYPTIPCIAGTVFL